MDTGDSYWGQMYQICKTQSKITLWAVLGRKPARVVPLGDWEEPVWMRGKGRLLKLKTGPKKKPAKGTRSAKSLR